MHIMYLTPEEQRVAIYEAVKTNDMSSLNPEAVRTYHIKDSWFKSPGICHRSSPAASTEGKPSGSSAVCLKRTAWLFLKPLFRMTSARCVNSAWDMKGMEAS